MFGFSPTCVDAFGEYPQAYGLGDYPTTGEIAVAVVSALKADVSTLTVQKYIALKGSDTPLIDTGFLRQSVTSKVSKKAG